MNRMYLPERKVNKRLPLAHEIRLADIVIKFAP